MISPVAVAKTSETYTLENVAGTVKNAFHYLHLDDEKFGTEQWNPLGEIIKPGMKVVIKPNLVKHRNGNEMGGLECLYTQPCVVESVLNYVVKAMNGIGQIIIGDATVQECDFDVLTKKSGYLDLVTRFQRKDINVVLKDFRGLRSVVKDGVHKQIINSEADGVVVDLGRDSEFFESTNVGDLRITNYDPQLMNEHHSDEKHEYLIAKDILEADVIINMPKPKSHRIAGCTISMKNYVGANVRKEYLPHHKIGSTGDESNQRNLLRNVWLKLLDKKNHFERCGNYSLSKFVIFLSRVCYMPLKILVNEKGSNGMWYGNDTIWRTILDLNKIIRYADKNGVIQEKPQRKQIIIADMIVAGDHEGPLCPSPKPCGMIVAGMDSVCFDEVVATLMGFDINKIPTIRNARKIDEKLRLTDFDSEAMIVSNDDRFNGKVVSEICKEDTFHFVPTSGWVGHIELWCG